MGERTNNIRFLHWPFYKRIKKKVVDVRGQNGQLPHQGRSHLRATTAKQGEGTTLSGARSKHRQALTSFELRICIITEMSLYSKPDGSTVPKVGQETTVSGDPDVCQGTKDNLHGEIFSDNPPCLEQDIYGMKTCYQLSLRGMVGAVIYLLTRQLTRRGTHRAMLYKENICS